MSIRSKSKYVGIVIVTTLLISVSVAAWSMNKIRIGGVLHLQDKQTDSLVADILPPPGFIIEPWLEVSLVQSQRGVQQEHLQRIEALHKTYSERKDFWARQDLPEELALGFKEATASADQFWQNYYSQYLPSIKAGDTTRQAEAYRDLEGDYEKQRASITALVDAAGAYQKKLAEEDKSILIWTVSLVGLLFSTIVGSIIAAVWFLLNKVLAPVSETAANMSSMANGDFEAGRRNSHRDDEIGEMTRALEVFRTAAVEQRDAQEKQKDVVIQLTGGLNELAAGNLNHLITEPFAAEYEVLRTSFNDSVQQLGTLIKRVAGAAQTVATGVAEIRAASDDFAIRNEQQAASLEETAAAMNQVTNIVKETAASANNVQRSIHSAHHEAREGGEVVERAVTAMAAIESSSEEISQIINVIDGIAFQTNLLALNAGVEAARAGDAGKGFAVVANEVRALAQRSADAAKDIKDLITSSTQQVSDGVKLVGETGDLLSKIVTGIGEINDRVSEIAKSTETQAASLQQVNGAVSEMDRMTQQNAAMVEQSTAAARSLADEASELANLVTQFRTGVENVRPAMPSIGGRSRKQARRVTAVSGNLALAAAPSDDDWTEF